MSIWRQIRAIAVLPGTVTIVVPGIILCYNESVNPGWTLSSPFSIISLLLGFIFVAVGLLLWIKTVFLFARIGKGTLAPWDAPRHMVVRGVYRYVRNPMISGVCCILLGEAILFGSLLLFFWFLFFVLLNVIYIPLKEEPDLVRRFGEEYRLYRENVPRWIPLVKPWNPPFDEEKNSGQEERN